MIFSPIATNVPRTAHDVNPEISRTPELDFLLGQFAMDGDR
jgi:hypothetical protein